MALCILVDSLLATALARHAAMRIVEALGLSSASMELLWDPWASSAILVAMSPARAGNLGGRGCGGQGGGHIRDGK
jgi:hypothetical protein